MSEPLEYETPVKPKVEKRWPQRWRPVAILLGVISLPSCFWVAAAMDGWRWAGVAMFTGPVAILLGLIDARTNRSEQRGHRLPIVLGALGLASLAVFFTLAPSTGQMRESAKRVVCASNLRQIGLAAVLYANANGNVYPADLSFITHSTEWDNEILICRSVRDDHVVAAFREDAVFRKSSAYVYLGRGLPVNPPVDEVLAVEPLANHGGEGANVLYAGGHVDWTSATQFSLILDDLVAEGRLAPELRDVLLELDR